MDSNIIQLAALQESDNALSPAAEESMALEFAARHVGHLKYVAAWSRWLSYEEGCWQKDETWHAFDLARVIVREVAASQPPTQGAKIASAKSVAAVERLAKADRRIAATAVQWDARPWLWNTGDAGTYDLRTGTGRDPDPADCITKKAACECAPAGTPHPIWTAFLNRVTNHDVELQQFLQRYIGYALTGFTSEHCFVFAYGTGANGKGTFINTIANIFGDYATTAAMSTFIASHNEQHPTDLAKLNGSRLVVAQETTKGRRWDETKIKTLTGGDKISARFMRADFFDFIPEFKLFICGNHKPQLSAVDEAMKRRLLLVPFTVVIPKGERDIGLMQSLVPEHPAILRWCVDGCLEWQRMGLAPPVAVRDATDSYFNDEDTMQQWLDECTQDEGVFAFTRSQELFANWKLWAEDRGFRAGSAKALVETLTDRGFIKHRNNVGQQGFKGLAIKKGAV